MTSTPNTPPGDHATPAALGEKAEFNALVEGMVADFAPRVFAVVEVYDDCIEAQVAAWGLAFEDHAEVVGVNGKLRMSLRAPEAALYGYAGEPDITPRLVWVNPDAATPARYRDF